MSLSQFPNQYDTFQDKIDISFNDITNTKRYQELKLKQNRTPSEDSELNNLTVTLRNKLFLPDDLNKLFHAMSNMQLFTKETLINYYRYRGDWVSNPTEPYGVFNSVKYTDGHIYIAYQIPNDSLPTDTTKWLKITAKGDQGIQGIAGVGLNYRGVFDGSTSYLKDDLITYNGNTYYCKENISGIFPTNSTYWELFVAGIGENLNNLQTEHKTSLVGAINEVNSKEVDLTPIEGQIGNLSTMTTTEKTNLAGAVSEVKDEITNHKTDTTAHGINNKVDKVAGKGLSTNDYTTLEKNKLASMPNDVFNAISTGSTSDPNTTQESYILSNHANSPGGGTYWHIQTLFYSTKAGNRSQIATRYNGGTDEMYIRTYYGSTWTTWKRVLHESNHTGTNPHGTTKSDVGLGSVYNYGIATQAEAEAGAVNTKYMTPLRVAQAIVNKSNIVFGSYMGTGSPQDIIVGKTPYFVIIYHEAADYMFFVSTAFMSILTSAYSRNTSYKIIPNGFSVGNGSTSAGVSGGTYKYIAFCE